MGIHLQGLAQTNTHGEYVRVREVYGFPISITSEKTVTDGIETVQNRFVVEGEYKYKYNNGFIAMSDTKAACMNFVNALERLPEIISQYEERTEKMRKDVPLLETIIAKPWGKEDELKALKSELAASTAKSLPNLHPSTMKRTARKSSTINRHNTLTVLMLPLNQPGPKKLWWRNHDRTIHLQLIYDERCTAPYPYKQTAGR